METYIDDASRRMSDIHLSKNLGEDKENDEPNDFDQQRFNKLVMKGKQLIGEGRIEEALNLNKKALGICYSEKLAKKIRKMEDYLKAHADDSEEEEDNGMIHLGKGFHLYRDLYNSLYAHQQEGVLWLWSLFRRKKGGILGDDMGLGKTIQIISFLSGMFDMQKIKSVLIVLPVAVMVNWDKEFQKWAPGLKVVAYHGNSKREKERALARVQRRGGVCLTTYGLVVTSWQQLGQQDGREFVWDYMILDEGHKIKNPTKTTKGVHAIPAHHRIIMTGTPVQNNLKELWSLFDFVHQGSLLGLQKTFKMEFENPITRAREKDATLGEKKLGMEMADSLKKIIEPYFLRRTKAEVKQREEREKDQPDSGVTHAVMPTMTRKNDLIVWTFLRDTQLNIYKDFLSLDSVKELLMTTKSPLVALNVLKKICDHPRLLSTRACAQLGIQGDEGLDDEILETEAGNLSAVTRIQHVADSNLINESGKLLFLVELLDRLKAEGHRCLVFSQSRKMLDIMQKVITNRGHKIMRLDGTIAQVQEREQRIQKFQTDSSYSVFLLTTQVGGVGLTLTAADRVVIFDPSWNPATDAQAVDRVFRIGQDKNVVIYRLITCSTVEEKIYRRQIFKDSITRQTTGNAKNPYRYFSKYELRELFTLDDPRSSTTQQQLEQMHSGQRLTDPSLDEHIAYLYSLDVFGLSDHDLMFSHGNEAGDEQDEDENGADPETDYIQHRVQKAREIIQMESSQPSTLEERLGKSTQQSGSGDNNSAGSWVKNQFSNWDFPKPGASLEEGAEEEGTESSGTSDTDHSEKVHNAESPQRNIIPDLQAGTEQFIDLTSPVVKQDVKQETDKMIEPRLDLTTPKYEQEGKSLKKEPHTLMEESADIEMTSPKKFVDSTIVKSENEPMEIGTPKRPPLVEHRTNGDMNLGEARMLQGNTPEKQGISQGGLFQVTPKSSKKDRSVILEEIIISPDASKPLIQTRPLSVTNLSTSSLQNISTFQPNFHSTIFDAVDSPDIVNQSWNSKNSLGYSEAGSSEMSAKTSPSRQPFKALVAESPDTSNASSGKQRHLHGKSSDSEENAEDSMIIEDSLVVSEGEEKENIEPGNISVYEIKEILQKSLCNNVDESLNESPVVTKSRRKSTAFRRRVIESSDEDDEGNSLPNISSTDRFHEPKVATPGEKAVIENTENEKEDSEEEAVSTDKEDLDSDDDNNESNVFADNEADDDESSNAEDDNDNNDVDTGSDESDNKDKSYDNKDAEMNDADEKNASVAKENCDDVINDDDDDEEMSEEETEDEEPEAFEGLPETDQIRYNELVEAGRIYCASKQYEDGQACVLQALEIFADPELQATSMTLQRKIMKQQQRLQMEKDKNMQT